MNPPSLRDVQDASFFRMDPFQGLSMEVAEEAAPTGVVIGGPKRWDPALEPICPLVAVIKAFRPDPVGFLRKKYGNVLVRNLTTGALFVRQAWSTEGKIPLYVPPSRIEVVPEIRERISTNVVLDWVMLASALAEGPPSALEISMLFVGEMSNAVKVVAGSPGLRWEETVGWHAARMPLTERERVDRRLFPDERCPVLSSPGIAWNLLPRQAGELGRWPLALGFCVEESTTWGGALRIPLRLVFAWLGSERALHLEIQVPLERTRVQGGLRLGNFLMDLHPLFQEPRLGMEIIPRHLHLLAMCGNVRQGPNPLSVGIAPDI